MIINVLKKIIPLKKQKQIRRLTYMIYIPYSFYMLLRYIVKTLSKKEGLHFLKIFYYRLKQTTDDQILHQDRKHRKLVTNYRNLEMGIKSIEDVKNIYNNFIQINNQEPNFSEGYMGAAMALSYLGKPNEVEALFKKSLILKEQQNMSLGLHLLELRFITEVGWGFNIGHLSHLDTLLKLRQLGLLSKEKRIIYARKKTVSNPTYLKYWEDHIEVIYLNDYDYTNFLNFIGKSDEFIGLLKLKKGFTNFQSAWSLAERTWESKQLPALLTLKDYDRNRGLQVFKDLGIPEDAWFVGLHVREGNPWVKTRSNSNADIITYTKAIKAITDRGGYVIRMGHPGMTPLPKMDRVIDYANSKYKSDWMDVFIWASCYFFVGTSSGPLSVPPTFGKPVLYTNCPVIGGNPYLPGSLMLPKLFYSETEKRLFTFREMMETSLAWADIKFHEGISCSIRDNSPEELEAGVIEMLHLLESDSPMILSDLQTQFNSIRNEYGDTGQTTISQYFVEKYSTLLL